MLPYQSLIFPSTSKEMSIEILPGKRPACLFNTYIFGNGQWSTFHNNSALWNCTMFRPWERDLRVAMGQDLREQQVRETDTKSVCQGRSKGYSRSHLLGFHKGINIQESGNCDKQNCFLRDSEAEREILGGWGHNIEKKG